MSITVAPEAWMCRATAFEILSLMFLPPDRGTAKALVGGEFSTSCCEVVDMLTLDGAEDISHIISTLLEAYEGLDEEEVYHALRQEHTHLFVGEREPLVTPYVGVWAAEQRGQNGLLFVGKESQEVERFMSRCGVVKNLAAGQANDPVDHVGTICEFLKYLCLVNAKAIQVPEHAIVENDDFENFLQKHFSLYSLWCSDKVASLARCPFYVASAHILRSVCGLPVLKSDS